MIEVEGIVYKDFIAVDCMKAYVAIMEDVLDEDSTITDWFLYNIGVWLKCYAHECEFNKNYPYPSIPLQVARTYLDNRNK